MLCIKWLEGESRGYTDIFPDSVLSAEPADLIVHSVKGSREEMRMAKCSISRTSSEIDFDYEAFASFNEPRGMLLGIMRIVIRDCVPVEVLWKYSGQTFVPAKVTISFQPGVSLVQSDLIQIRKGVPNLTERLQLINARVGQGKFREKLQIRWNGRCALTEVTNDTILRASHIKPWAVCEHEERLDPNNGLLLAAHVDALFDQYLITFRGDGKLIWSSRVSISDRETLALPENLCSELGPEEQNYLKHHNEAFS